MLAILLTVVGPSRAFAAPQKSKPTQSSAGSFDRAKAEYSRVRQTDPTVNDLGAWEGAASRLIAFLKDNPKSPQNPKCLLILGRLYETTYRERQFNTGLTRAMYFYEELAREYRGDELADDALLALGDLRRTALHDNVAAKAAYYEIVDTYQRGDQFQAAMSRLEGLDPVAPVTGKPVITAKKTPAAKEVIADLPSPSGSGILSLSNKQERRELYSSNTDSKRPLVVIDPGHGGEDLGAAGYDDHLEKDVTLNIATYLEEMLRDQLRAKTIVTRMRDETVPLATRTKIANDNKADLFISIHANASEYKNASGIETYYLDNTNDKSSMKLAERENQSIKYGGTAGDLSLIVSDLIQNAKLDDSIALAHHVQSGMVNTLSKYYQGVKNLGVKKAPFYVLVGAHMPCVLVEVSFIDHPVEGRRLTERRYQVLAANAIYRGIRAFFERQQ